MVVDNWSGGQRAGMMDKSRAGYANALRHFDIRQVDIPTFDASIPLTMAGMRPRIVVCWIGAVRIEASEENRVT
jgi:hypothetical protein